jgi:hypothetical protein
MEYIAISSKFIPFSALPVMAEVELKDLAMSSDQIVRPSRSLETLIYVNDNAKTEFHG